MGRLETINFKGGQLLSCLPCLLHGSGWCNLLCLTGCRMMNGPHPFDITNCSACGGMQEKSRAWLPVRLMCHACRGSKLPSPASLPPALPPVCRHEAVHRTARDVPRQRRPRRVHRGGWPALHQLLAALVRGGLGGQALGGLSTARGQLVSCTGQPFVADRSP